MSGGGKAARGLLLQLVLGQQSLVVRLCLLSGRRALLGHLELGVVVGGVQDGQHALLELGGISARLGSGAILGVLAQNLDLAKLADCRGENNRRRSSKEK